MELFACVAYFFISASKTSFLAVSYLSISSCCMMPFWQGNGRSALTAVRLPGESGFSGQDFDLPFHKLVLWGCWQNFCWQCLKQHQPSQPIHCWELRAVALNFLRWPNFTVLNVISMHCMWQWITAYDA